VRTSLALVILSLLAIAPARAAISLHGNLPLEQEPGFEEKINQIWDYEKGHYLDSTPDAVDPDLYFFPFDRSQESADFVSWQNDWILKNPSVWTDYKKATGFDPPATVTLDWMQQNPDILPFPKAFVGLHYGGTDRMQIDPQVAFLQYFQPDGMGRESDLIGFGYYVTAHELLHYAFEQRGIPGRIHHCLFVASRPGKPTIMEELAQFLIDNKISNQVIMFTGARDEGNHCLPLSAADQALVNRYAAELP
jgi:hypothetical protein